MNLARPELDQPCAARRQLDQQRQQRAVRQSQQQQQPEQRQQQYRVPLCEGDSRGRAVAGPTSERAERASPRTAAASRPKAHRSQPVSRPKRTGNEYGKDAGAGNTRFVGCERPRVAPGRRRKAGCNPALLLAACFALLCLPLRADVGLDVSGLFTTDTRWGFSDGAAVSGFFQVDTRLSGSASEANFGLFTVDTTGAAAGSVSIVGFVKDMSGAGLSGATVSALQSSVVRTQTATDAAGHYLLTALPPGGYELRAVVSGYATAAKMLVLSEATAPQNFTLQPIPPPPATQVTTRPIAAEQQPHLPRVSGTQLKVYTDAGWVTGGTVDTNKMIVVLTHGRIANGDPEQNSGINGWPARMAAAMWSKLRDNRPNILGWDWRADATGDLLGALVDKTPGQGLALGQALHQALGGGYQQPVHFIGHSLGTLVNATAANYLHGDMPKSRDNPPQLWDAGRTHVTLLDEAEVATVTGQKTRVGWDLGSTVGSTFGVPIEVSSGALGGTVAAINDWRHPIPKQFIWVDNYISVLGINHPEAVNVALQLTADFMFDFDAMHGYPVDPWYSGTVALPSQSFLGFASSFEMRGAMPPAGSAYRLGVLYMQAGSSLSDPYPLRVVSDDDWTQAQQEWLKRSALNWKDSFVDGTKQVVSIYGDILVETKDATVSGIEAGVDWVGNAGDNVWEFVSHPLVRLELRSQPPSGGANLAGRSKTSVEETNTPAYAWMEVGVPANAVFLTFEFTVAGDGQDDSVVCGVNGTNVFTLQTKLLAEDVPTSSSLIDVSAYAGSNVELFFGLLGGTSTNCFITVENIRFSILPPPVLSVGLAGGQCLVRWPASASGFVLESTGALSQTNTAWTTITNAPGVVDFLNTVTNDMSGGSRFYRLRRQD